MASDVKGLFYSLQDQLTATLRGSRSVFSHPGAKGNASETDWIAMLEAHLPSRYSLSKAFVLDSNGQCSDEIDIVIYDRQYTPLLYNHSGQRFIPAESVYAVFEVKQTFDRANIVYAGKKAASVRKLQRTSASITHAGGVYNPRELTPILAGILAYKSAWTPPWAGSFQAVLEERKKEERLDFGCALSKGSFEAKYSEDGAVSLTHGNAAVALISFFLNLLQRLQGLGTVPAIDYGRYIKALNETSE